MDGLGLSCGIFLLPECGTIKHKLLFPSAESLNGDDCLPEIVMDNTCW